MMLLIIVGAVLAFLLIQGVVVLIYALNPRRKVEARLANFVGR